MCDTRGHEHWCSGCGKNLNKVPADSYIEIEWSQNDKGQIVEEKGMICKQCMEDMENVKELTEFFKTLEYSPWGHIFCSVCKKDLTKELGKDIKPGTDYECLNFKCHERSGPNIRHIIRVVVMCKDCVKTEFNAENLTKLKKLGKNPLFKPMVTCPNTEICKQFKEGDEQVNCKNIVIGRDRESLQFGLLCGRRHKGAQLLPFDDGFSVRRPRKGKGAAAAMPPGQSIAVAPGVDPIQDAMRQMEKLLKKYKLGVFANPVPDHGGKFFNIELRLLQIEKTLGIQNDPNFAVAGLNPVRPIQVCQKGESSGASPGDSIMGPIPIITSVHNVPEGIEEDIEHDEVAKMAVLEHKAVMKIHTKEKKKKENKD